MKLARDFFTQNNCQGNFEVMNGVYFCVPARQADVIEVKRIQKV